MPPVSKVCQACPHVQDQRSRLAGFQPQTGQRMRGPFGPVFSSCCFSSISGVIEAISNIMDPRLSAWVASGYARRPEALERCIGWGAARDRRYCRPRHTGCSEARPARHVSGVCGPKKRRAANCQIARTMSEHDHTFEPGVMNIDLGSDTPFPATFVQSEHVTREVAR
jgi:hypothetical protein